MNIVRNVFQVLKELKHRENRPKFCPRCGSPKIHLSSRFDIWLTPGRYVCENCGYRGPIVMELEEEKEAHSQKAEKQA